MHKTKIIYLASKYYKNQNNRQFIKNIAASYIIKGAAMIVAFYTTPAYIRYFDNHIALGIWFTIISVFNWILTFDFGIGNGLRNNIVKPLTENDTITIKKNISSAYIVMGVICVLALVALKIGIRFVDWNYFLSIEEDIISPQVLKNSIEIISFGIVIQLWLKLITSVLYAMQKTALPSFFTLITTVALIIFTRITNFSNINEKIIYLSYAQVLCVNLPLIFATAILFSTSLRDCWPSFNYYDKDIAAKTVKVGGTFFFIQLALMAISSTNEIFITKLYSAEDVVYYQIYFKLFRLVIVLFSLCSQPIWSGVRQAYVEHRHQWIKKINSLFIIFASVTSFGCFGLSLILQPLVNLWLGQDSIVINLYIALIFAIYSAVNIFMYVFTSIANGAGRLKCQIICTSIGIAIKFASAYILVQYFDNWSVIMVSNIIALLPVCIAQPIVNRIYFKKDERYQ